MTINNLKISDERLRNICQKYLVKELAVFGSTLTSDFRNDSDIDLLYTFHDEAEHSLFSKVRIKEEIEELFGRPVDLGGYYLPDDKKAEDVMRPSSVFNKIVDGM